MGTHPAHIAAGKHPRTRTARVLAITNMRGGCAKTTNALHVGLASARMGNRVLMVDLDPQAHLTLSLVLAEDPVQFVDEALADRVAKPTRTTTENVSVLPSRIELSGLLESGIFAKVRWEEMLLKVLDPLLGDFDLVVVDTPATFSKLHAVALRASDAYVISIRPEAFSVVGYDESRAWVDAFKQECGGLVKPHFLGHILSGVPKAKRKAVDRIREGLTPESEEASGENQVVKEEEKEKVSDIRAIEIPLSANFDEARWSDGTVNRSIFDITGTEELQAAYLEACGKIMKWMNDAEETI